jgi:proline racemase
MKNVRIVDSHTAGEPTRVVIEDETQRGHVLPYITGSAYVTAEATFIFDDADPLCWGIRSE